MIDLLLCRVWPLTLATLTALLVGCGSQSSVAFTTIPVELTVRVDGAGQKNVMTPQGIPFKEDGTPAFKTLRVRVFEGRIDGVEEEAIHFDDQGNEDPEAPHNYIDIPQGANSVTLKLSPGIYSFSAVGLGDSAINEALAVGTDSQRNIGRDSSTTINLHMRTMTGEFKLKPRLPLKYIMPGQIFDINFVIQTPVVNGKRFTVPIDDFEVTAYLEAGSSEGLTLLKGSNLGARLRAPDLGSEIQMVSRINMYHQSTQNDYTNDRKYAFLTLPIYSETTVGADLQRPSLSVLDSAQFAGRIQIRGTADDNVGLAKLQVYDGPVLFASSDTNDTGDGIEQIYFDGNQWTLEFKPLNSENHDFTLLAQDTSGNENRVAYELPKGE